MYKIIITATIVASVLSSCSNKRYDETEDLRPSKPTVFSNQIEAESYWGGQVTFEKVKNAHSGNMVSLINEQNPYSVIFHHKLIELPDTSAKKISISAWVNYSDTVGAKAVLVISIDADGKNLAWLGTPVEKMSKIIPNQWTLVTTEYTIPKMTLTGNENLGICFWNQSKANIMVDDFEVKFTR